MEPVETYAKESFTGTKQVVESYTGDGKPFVILDIVPSFATYEWDEQTFYEISTGTLGYLSNGQAPMIRIICGFIRSIPQSFPRMKSVRN